MAFFVEFPALAGAVVSRFGTAGPCSCRHAAPGPHAVVALVVWLRQPGGWGKGRPRRRRRVRAKRCRETGPMWLVTGGAGFIGSNVVASLNEAGRSDVVVNDSLDTGEEWRNLGKRQLADVVDPADLIRWLDGRKLDAVIHLGAISDTTAADGDLVIDFNF